MDYSTLVAEKSVSGSIKDWLNYERIPAEAILTEAQAWIYGRMRHEDMVREASVAIALGASSAAKPDGFLDPIHLGIPGYVPTLAYRDRERFRAMLALDQDGALPAGMPTAYARFRDTLAFNTEADQAYTAHAVFYGTPEALSVDNETNFLTDRYPTLLRRACLMFAAENRKEWDLRDRYERSCMADIQTINVENDLALRGVHLDYNWDEAH